MIKYPNYIFACEFKSLCPQAWADIIQNIKQIITNVHLIGEGLTVTADSQIYEKGNHCIYNYF